MQFGMRGVCGTRAKKTVLPVRNPPCSLLSGTNCRFSYPWREYRGERSPPVFALGVSYPWGEYRVERSPLYSHKLSRERGVYATNTGGNVPPRIRARGISFQTPEWVLCAERTHRLLKRGHTPRSDAEGRNEQHGEPTSADEFRSQTSSRPWVAQHRIGHLPKSSSKAAE